MAGFSLAISGPKTHFEVAGARGAPGTGFVALYVGAGWPPPRKKYEIRYPPVPSDLISPKTVSGVLPEFPDFHIRRWLARPGTPAPGLPDSTWGFGVRDPEKNTKSDIRPFRTVHFH